MKLTIDNLKLCLSKIDYKLKGEKPNRFIYNHKDKNTGVRVWNDTIDFKMDSGITTVAVMNNCTIKMLGKDTVQLGNQKIFVQFHNFSKQKS